MKLVYLIKKNRIDTLLRGIACNTYPTVSVSHLLELIGKTVTLQVV